jgi:malonyl-CoA O-methyltransferase
MRKAQRAQRGVAGAKRLMQSAHKARGPQARHTAHWPAGSRRCQAVSGFGQARACIGSIYCPPMPDVASQRSSLRPVQAAALARTVRRWGRATQPPWLHGEVARRMAERLRVVRLQPRTCIDWWSFCGASRELLLQAYARARLLLVEPDEALRQRSRDALRAPWWSSRRWTSAGAEVLALESVAASSAELLWANMMLHMVDDPQALMQRWHRALAVDGFLMFSTLGPGSLQGLRSLYTRMGWPAAHAPFVDMHDLGDMLVHAGFADPVMDQEIITLTWADAPALLGELRCLGGNADPRRSPGLRTPRWRERLCDELACLRAADGRLHLDFEVVYGHAFKAAPKPPLAAETKVALDDMRAMVRSGRRGPGGPDGLR